MFIELHCFSFRGKASENIIRKSDLHDYNDFAFPKTIKDILTHDQKCKNKKCKENGLNELKVVDVEYIGLTQEAFSNDKHIWRKTWI